MAKVRFRGVKTARRKLAQNMRGLQRAGAEESREICEFIVDHIRAHAPYDPTHDPREGPHLRDIYRVRPHPSGDGRYLITVDKRNRYWLFVEFGTRKMQAQPHVRPAFDAARQRFRW